MKPQKILVIRFSSIGDIILTTPVIRCLKTQLKDAEIHFLTKKQYAPVLVHNPYLTKVHFYEGRMRELVETLLIEEFDFIVDLHNNLRSFLIKWHLAIPVKSFNKLNFRKWLLVNLKINLLPMNHIVQRYLKTTSPLGVTDDGLGLDYFIPENEKINISQLPLTHVHGYAAIAIGAQHNTKKLPLVKLKELCQLLPVPLILLGDNNDALLGIELEKMFPYKVFNGCGKFNINQSASLVQQAKVVFTHDTSIMHIAAAFHKTIHSFWGNTVPEFGMTPYYGQRSGYETNSLSFIHEIKNLKCRPCSKIGFKSCPEKHFMCMNNQSYEFIKQMNLLPESS